MICSNCNYTVDSGAAFCPNCGHPVSVSGTLYGVDISGADYGEETMPMMPPISEIPSTEFCLKCGKVLRTGQICSCSMSSTPAYELDASRTEVTRVDDPIVPPVSEPPLGPTYRVPPHREEFPRVYPEPSPVRPAAGSASDGKSFFKTVNKL